MESSSSDTRSTDEGPYRLLVNGIVDYAIYMLDPDGRVVSWNPGARRFKGYEAEEIIGQHFSRFYTAEDQVAGLPARALAQAENEGRFEQEGWRVRKDGSTFWAHVVIDPIRASDGELLGFAKITRDLSERREGELALRQSQEQFRLLVLGVTDYAIYMLDPTGHVSNWNPGAERIKGYRRDEIVGQHFSRFYTEEDRAAGAPEAALATAAREGRFEKEGWRLRKDGSRFWAHVVIDAIRDEQGEVIGFAKVTRDITERLEGQKALEEAREALFQAQKMDAIGQLTGGIAHDFNNLLMAVIGSLDLVIKRIPPDPRITPLLNNAMQGAQRGAALTQRLLAFARKQDLKLEAVDVPTLVAGLTPLLERAIGPRVGIDARLPHRLPLVLTDPFQLETALLNLAVNARDAMPDGAGAITITGDAVRVGAGDPGLSEGEYVRLAVTDEGEGMDTETLARAVEPFFTTKGVGKGTGLGLSMVHGLASQSGGRLSIDSRSGEGTTVTLWLPVADTSVAAAVRREAPEPSEHGPAGLRILAVDDDGLVLLNAAAMLEDLGHHVTTADSGQTALEALARADFDLVITDHVMPCMTGLQLAKTIRRRQPDLPVVLATGYAELGPGELMDFPRLSKPYSQADLAEQVRLATEARPVHV
jgi:PAS domain S-box-containing protein